VLMTSQGIAHLTVPVTSQGITHLGLPKHVTLWIGGAKQQTPNKWMTPSR